jgi:hypothetical protein
VSAHVQERLSVYLDGELPQTERAEVDAHLRGCAACARHLEELAAVDAAARDLPVPAPPGYFDSLPARVAARLPAPRTTRRPQPQTWVWAAAAAALALAVLTPLTVRRTTLPVPEAAEAPPYAEGVGRELARDTSKDKNEVRARAVAPAPTAAPLAGGRLEEKAMAPAPPPPAPAVQAQRHAGPFAQQQNQAPAAAPPAPAAEAIDAVAESAARPELEQKEEAPKLKKQAPIRPRPRPVSPRRPTRTAATVPCSRGGRRLSKPPASSATTGRPSCGPTPMDRGRTRPGSGRSRRSWPRTERAASGRTWNACGPTRIPT